MVDVVYPLGSGSTWGNNELRYSLRSIEKHLKNCRHVYIIGEDPGWEINNVTLIPFEDRWHPSRNIMEKIRVACRNQQISDEFIFMNDDFFLLQDVDASTYPYYNRGQLKESIPKNVGNWYQNYVIDTMKELRSRSLPELNFDMHCPIRYHRNLFLEVMQKYDFDQKLTVKSIYCNTLGIEGEYMEDCKIAGRMADFILERKIKDRHIFSTGDRCLLPYHNQESAVKQLLNNLYPNPSKYEI